MPAAFNSNSNNLRDTREKAVQIIVKINACGI
jgi:hypothetical protein